MRETFDRRVVPDAILHLLRRLGAHEDVRLAGGLALSGAHLAHRKSDDVDLFVRDADGHRRAIRVLQELVRADGGRVDVVQGAPSFWRAEIELATGVTRRFDVVHERVAAIVPDGEIIEGVVVESWPDLRAAKLTCLLSRSEPRDLVDVMFLERAGHPPESDLELALMKDAGMDPGTLAWLLSQFPTSPLPSMLEPLSEEALRRYRDELATRMKRLATAVRG
ncbi:MAG: nucleotidyl transferase AbiEii/AbiGii toxin family protein [Myxococcota bacterium]